MDHDPRLTGEFGRRLAAEIQAFVSKVDGLVAEFDLLAVEFDQNVSICGTPHQISMRAEAD